MAHALLALAIGLQAISAQAKFDAGRAWEHLRQLVAIGPRPSGSPAIEQTRTYIKATADPAEAPGSSAFWKAAARAEASPEAWRYREIATNHMIPNNRPAELAGHLLELA